MASTSDNEVERLRREAEKALRRSRRAASVERALQRLLDRAEEGSDDSLYARRHLAELQLESNPWNAALHLRRVIQSHGSDDVLHALMGLAQALLGNYQAAARAYQRALKLAPENPWYHHNLGHLLDVALMKPARAEHHLRRAYQMEPEQDEIAASLAHCLARIHQMNEAEELARQALKEKPGSRDHRSLLEWIEKGARDDSERSSSDGGNSTRAKHSMGAKRRAARPSRSMDEAVKQLLEQNMTAAGFSTDEVNQAQTLWGEFLRNRSARLVKPEGYAAAIEYLLSARCQIDGVTQEDIARRYGIARNTLSRRYLELRRELHSEHDRD